MTPIRSLVQRCRTGDAFFSGAVLLVFLTFGIIGLRHHEMWRDEVYGWLAARDSSTLTELLRNTRYDPHFKLWNFILWFLTRFTRNCEAMQWLHLMLATAAVWLFVQCSPFTRLQKALFSFGYFPLYEYCVVCRNYVLIVLLTFLFCALFTYRTRSHLALSAVLFLLMNVNIFGVLIAIALAAVMFIEFLPINRLADLWRTRKFDLIGGGVVLLLGLAGPVLQVASSPKDSVILGWQHPLTMKDLVTSCNNIWRAYVPIPLFFPDPGRCTWGTNYLTDGFPRAWPVAVALSLALLVISAVILQRARPALVCYLVGTSLFLLFYYFVNAGALRHQGLVFMLFLACVWLARSYQNTQRAVPTGWFAHWENSFLVALLVPHLLAALYVSREDFSYRFSASKDAT
jgi:hypothetical protein